MNLAYLNVTLTGKALQWKLSLQDVHSEESYLTTICERNKKGKRKRQRSCKDMYDKIAAAHHSSVGH
jgi:hypothetical protein